MFFKKRRQEVKKVSSVDLLPGIEPDGKEALAAVGITGVSQLEGADAEHMYYLYTSKELSKPDVSILYQFRCAVYYATVREPDPKKLHWWYWKDEPGAKDSMSEEELFEIYNSLNEQG